MRILGLDLGTKRIGVAISDELLMIARPLEIVEFKTIPLVIEKIKNLVSYNNVGKIVIGLPINMDGSMNERCSQIKDFGNKLKSDLSIEIDFFDERLSTVQANNLLIEADISRKKRKTITDKLAAQFILQGYLDMKGKKK